MQFGDKQTLVWTGGFFVTVSTQQNVTYNIREQAIYNVRHYSEPELSSQELGRKGEGRGSGGKGPDSLFNS